MKITFRLVGGFLMTAAAVIVMGSCVSDKDSSGLEYMPDMYRSPAIEPYVDYGEIRGRQVSELKEQLSAMHPPLGTVPYYGTNEEEVRLMLPWNIRPNVEFKSTHGLTGYEFTKENTYETQAKNLVVNPYTLTEENQEYIFKEGKRLYTNNCAHCHGEKGDGNGPMMVNGTFTGVPNYADKKALSNGQLFYSIYYGKGAMGAHASLLNKREIWTLVHYIRKFQNKDYGADTQVGSSTNDEDREPLGDEMDEDATLQG